MILKINQWIGRLGNNILIQITTALCIGLYYRYNIEIPKHEMFNTTQIKISENTDSIIYSSNFVDEGEIIEKFGSKWKYFTTLEIVSEYIRKIFIIDVDNIPSLSEDNLVIHIRSGDIFIHPHPNYLVPPLYYYKKIIEDNKFKNIQIICEDKLNPCVDRLLQLYPHAIYKQQDLYTDIYMILSAQNVVSCIGTFIPALMKISKNIKNLYLPSYGNYGCEQIQDKIFTIDLNEYYKLCNSIWEKTDSQMNLLLNYKI